MANRRKSLAPSQYFSQNRCTPSRFSLRETFAFCAGDRSSYQPARRNSAHCNLRNERGLIIGGTEKSLLSLIAVHDDVIENAGGKPSGLTDFPHKTSYAFSTFHRGNSFNRFVNVNCEIKNPTEKNGYANHLQLARALRLR